MHSIRRIFTRPTSAAALFHGTHAAFAPLSRLALPHHGKRCSLLASIGLSWLASPCQG